MPIVSDSSAPLFVVTGATGAQGGSVVRALEASTRNYRVRAITRDPSKPAAKALEARGVELAKANLVPEEAADVRKAFEGANIVFIVTDYWSYMDKQKETDAGIMMVDAAHAVGAKRIIWSGLHSVSKVSNGLITQNDIFESKAVVTEYAQKKFAGSDVAFVNVEAGQYFSEYTKLSSPHIRLSKIDEDTLLFTQPGNPDAKMPLIDMESDYGRYVVLAVEDEKYAKGGEIFTASQELTRKEIAVIWGEAIGKKIVYRESTQEEWVERLLSFGAPAAFAPKFAEAFFGLANYGYYGKDPITPLPGARTFKDFVNKQDWAALANW